MEIETKTFNPEPLVFQSTRPSREAVRSAFFEKNGGVTAELADLADKISGGPARRHAERVTATIGAALHWSRQVVADAYLPEDSQGEKVAEAGAALIIFADIVGVGGRYGLGGSGTLRHPAFRRLGAGRKQATDGGAWMAAARDALRALLGERQRAGAGAFLWFEVRDERPTASVGGPDDIGPTFFLPAEWLRSTLTIIALEAAGVSLFDFRHDLDGTHGQLRAICQQILVVGDPDRRVEAIDRYREIMAQADVDDHGYITSVCDI